MIFKALCALTLILGLVMAQEQEFEMEITYNYIDMTPYEGEVIKGSNTPDQYLVLDGSLRYISAESKANCFIDSFTTIDQAIVDQMPVGNNLPTDCALVKAPTGQIFFPDNCTSADGHTICWRWVYNPEAFNKYNLNWDTIVDVPQVLMDSPWHVGNIYA